MITQFRIREGQKCRGKKHGLIVRVGDKKTYAFIAKLGEGAVGNLGSVEPSGCKKDWDYGGDEVKLHIFGMINEDRQQLTRSVARAMVGHIED